MKKFTIILLASFLLLFNSTSTHAASVESEGGKYTLNGTITNTYFNARATGENSSNVNVGITTAKYVRTDRAIATISINQSAMTYITYYGTSISNFAKWREAKIYGSLPSNQYKLYLTLKN